MEAAIGDDNTWYEFLPILGWIIADAAVARGTLEQAVQQLDRAAAEANRLAAIAHGGSYATVVCLLRRDVYVALDLDRVRVADLLREEPAAAEPGPVAVLRPNYGLLVNVSHGIDLLLRTEPTEQAMQAFSLRWEEDRDIWYPGWLASVKMEVGNALRSLALASLQARGVRPDLDLLLAVPTSSEPDGAATGVDACAATAGRCATAVHHARQASENMGELLVNLRGLREEILDDPPPGRVMEFFGPPIADPDDPDADAGKMQASIACALVRRLSIYAFKIRKGEFHQANHL
ncbi:uncharacterized protein LOC123405473 isoform X2 [Hordeum vulgare subsp. vulgare]|uniref:uncharacterized protein LOC123405473 isoform X2 n=1 Tax=Hordeum vulgare subsp. vulgare TaxID=112509 RepID=UPI001D1A3421|nr:uncharacterized protein LOC123405473 isoform X2 [Hordeum vulgare subsp. vulgare]